MSEKINKSKVHVTSMPGENPIGSDRYHLLRAAAERAAEAFKKGFFLEAITLTESLLGTRLECRLAWVRRIQTGKPPVEFSTLNRLCEELLGKRASAVLCDAEAFKLPIQAVREWVDKRNEALHEMAKLIEEDTHDFSVKYKRSRVVVLEGFKVLLAYDALDRRQRRAVDKHTATDDKK